MNSYRKPHRYKKKKPIYRNRFFWLGLLTVVFLFSIFYFLFLSGFFQIEKIIISGEDKVPTEEIRSRIENKLGNKILFWQTKSIFLVNLAEMKKDVLAAFPGLAAVEIKRNFPDGLSIIVVERAGIAQWFAGERSFLLDNEGVIFETSSPESDFLKIVDANNSDNPALGLKVIEKEELSRITGKIWPELRDNLKIPIKEFLISSEDKLTVLTQEGWEIYFNLQGDVEWQLTKLKAVLEEKIPQDRRVDLQYIELRFGNFAPFKYKD
ncbi:MAG: FtsQ-type POTRA domain-containing protein [Candidatus Pacebacteria bacterium]|nr:FtsQ-type POTRA domain-containing protein [Candidatus Paceibacterota bacterium]